MPMKKVFIVALLLISGMLKAQEEKGIRFERGLSWAQVKEKAKKENKYIFVDGYTTWCLPCRIMAEQVFPQPKVGEFFNANFINVAVQFDVTKKDNQEVKSWYKDAKLLEKNYNIKSFPTFLFFNPGGELVHTIIGGTTDADVFIAKAKAALDPSSQYTILKAQYDTGKRSHEFLHTLIKAAQDANAHRFVPVVVNEYLLTQTDLLTDENLGYVVLATSKKTDPGYGVLINHPEKLDAVAGTGTAAKLVKEIAFDEIVLPELRIGGTRTKHGFMVVYGGKINPNVNWADLKAKLDTQYPALSEEIVMSAKPIYFEWTKDWGKFTEAVSAYADKYEGESINNELNGHAWTVFTTLDDSGSLNAALEWSKKTLSGEKEKNPGYLHTYGNLLYKAGKKEEAISVINQMAKLMKQEDPRVDELLTKMKRGEKVW